MDEYCKTVISLDQSVPPGIQFTLTDVKKRIERENYQTARGWLTNRKGHTIEITLDDVVEYDRILADGLDFPQHGCHVEFRAAESREIVITVGNIPIEAKNGPIVEAIEAHGAKIEKIENEFQPYLEGTALTGRRLFTVTKFRDFQSLPSYIPLFNGRFISFRHAKQHINQNNWNQPDRNRNESTPSYANAVRRMPPSSQDRNISHKPTRGDRDEHRQEPKSKANTSKPFELVQFSEVDIIPWEDTLQTTCPEDIPKLSIEYFTWLLQQPSHLHPDHAQGYNRFWRTCIEKIRYENRVSKQGNITPTPPIQDMTQTPPPQQIQHVHERELAEHRKVPLNKRSQLIMQKIIETTVTQTILHNPLPNTETHSIQMEVETPQPATETEATPSSTDTACQPTTTTPQHVPTPLPETATEQMETTDSPILLDPKIAPAPTAIQPHQNVSQPATPALHRPEDLEPTRTETIPETPTATTPCIPETAPISNTTPRLETTPTTNFTEHEVLICNSAMPPEEITEDTTPIESVGTPYYTITQQIDPLTPTMEEYKGVIQDEMPPTPTMLEDQPDVQNGSPTNRTTPAFKRDPSIDLPGNEWCFSFGEIDLLSDEPGVFHLNSDEEPLCDLSAARNRCLEQMTVVEPSDGGRENQAITPTLESWERESTPQDSDAEEGEITSEFDLEVHTETPQAEKNMVPALTTTELGPDYGNQATSSQCLAPYPRTKRKKGCKTSGSENEIGVVPPSPKKANMPEGHTIIIGNFKRTFTAKQEKGIRAKVNGNERLSHEVIFYDMLFQQGQISSMLDHHHVESSKQERHRTYQYFGYLLHRMIGPCSTGWTQNFYIEKMAQLTLEYWDKFEQKTPEEQKIIKEECNTYLDMINMRRREGKT